MPARATVTAARCRGTAAGALTAVVAALAHSWAGGMAPAGAHAVLLGVVAAGIGGVTAVAPARVSGLLGILAVGQVTSHLVLAGHDHVGGAPATGAPMLVAHIAAVVTCAVLLTAASGLAAALSRTVHALVTAASPLITEQGPVRRPTGRASHRRHVFATSISHRGPPVGVR